MSNIQTGAERMPHDLSHLGFLRSEERFSRNAERMPHDLSHLGFLDRKSGSAGMPRPISYAVFCLKKKKENHEKVNQIEGIETSHSTTSLLFVRSASIK